MTAELMELKATLTQSQQREKKSGCLVQELTAMVKEQKNRITELIKAKRDAVASLKVLYTDFFLKPPAVLRGNYFIQVKKNRQIRYDQSCVSITAFSKTVRAVPVGR